jgi:hypothetical protein
MKHQVMLPLATEEPELARAIRHGNGFVIPAIANQEATPMATVPKFRIDVDIHNLLMAQIDAPNGLRTSPASYAVTASTFGS